MSQRAVPGSLDPQGPVAETISDLWWVMLALGVAVFALFLVLLAVALFRRGSSDVHSPRPKEEASLGRWIVWGGVVLPVAVLLVVLGATLIAMRAVPVEAPADALVVEVIGHQWWYEVRYPEEGVETANELHIPVGRPVALRLTSADVIHSFWVPPLGGKIDMLPDRTNTLVLQADEPGRHINRCAEFCGLQHTRMGMVVVAQSQDEFSTWVADRSRPPAEPQEETAIRGRAVFLQECGSCHAIGGTGGQETRGPDLTHLAGRTTLGAATVPNTSDNLSRWIRDPHAIKAGVKMPGTDLSDQQMTDLLTYLGTLE